MPFRAHEKLPKQSKTTVVVLNSSVVSGSCITGAKWHCPLNPKASLNIYCTLLTVRSRNGKEGRGRRNIK